MATPTTRLKLKKQALSENLNTWGLSNGINGVIDQVDVLAGYLEVDLGTSTSYTFGTTNYSVAGNEHMYRAVKFTGTPASGVTVNIPAVDDFKFIENATGQTITFSNGSTTATLANTFTGYLRTDGSSSITVLVLPDGVNIQIVANDINNVNLVAGQISPTNNISSVAGKVTEIGRLGTTAAVADLAALGGTQEVSNLNTLAPRAADMQSLAPRASDIQSLAPREADLNTLSPRASDIQSLAPRASDLQALAPREADLNTLSPRASDLQTLGPRSTDIGTLADLEDGTTATNVLTDLGARSSDMQTLAPRASDMQALSPRASDMQNLAPRASDMQSLAPRTSELQTLGPRASDLQALGPRASDIQSLAPRASDMQTLATAPLPTDITTVAGINAAVSSVASSENSINSFGKTYSTGAGTINTRGDGTGSSPATGDLRFNQTTSKMVVYDGSSWVAAGSATNNIIEQQTYTATANQTTFPSSGTIAYNPGFALVFVNGVKLENGTDVNVSSGTNFVLTTGAQAGDSVQFIGYGTFVVADTYTQAQADARYVQPSGNVATATTATNVAGGAAQGILYQSATSTTAHLAAGAAGTVLQSNGTGSAPTWVASSTIATPTGVASVMKLS